MARKRASMREGPLADLFKATEASKRQTGEEEQEPAPHQCTPSAALSCWMRVASASWPNCRRTLT